MMKIKISIPLSMDSKIGSIVNDLDIANAFNCYFHSVFVPSEFEAN